MNKIAVINFSGNVGKSTVSQHLLSPRMGNAPIKRIESINSDGTGAALMRGNQFSELQEYLLTVPRAVVDVGSSNVEDFVNAMSRYTGSSEDYDLFVIPTVPLPKQQVDTITTLTMLHDTIGVPREKIRLVFNMRDTKQELHQQFRTIFDYYKGYENFVLNQNVVIEDNPLYEHLKDLGRSIAEITSDKTDYVAENAKAIKTGAPEEDKAHIRKMIAVTRLARRVSPQLDQVFEQLVA